MDRAPEDKCLFCAASLPAEYFKIYERRIHYDNHKEHGYIRVCPLCLTSPYISLKLKNKCSYTSHSITFKPIKKVNGGTLRILKNIGQLLVRVSQLEKRMEIVEAKKNG